MIPTLLSFEYVQFSEPFSPLRGRCTAVASFFPKTNYYKGKYYLGGIDVSKDEFDMFSESKEHVQYDNNESGFKTFCKSLEAESHCMMEATDSYHYPLAVWLYDQRLKFTMMNPMVIRRFKEIRMNYTKDERAAA
jgi:hypothetical protein